MPELALKLKKGQFSRQTLENTVDGIPQTFMKGIKHLVALYELLSATLELSHRLYQNCVSSGHGAPLHWKIIHCEK